VGHDAAGLNVRPVIERLGDDEFAVRLGAPERELLGDLTRQLGDLLETDSPLLARLFPPPYGDDVERNEGYAALAVPELIEHRRESLDRLQASTEADVLDEDQMAAWMRSVNDLRLVLGTLLGVESDDEPPEVPEELEQLQGIYEFLGSLLDTIVHALAS
jgi:hypothetical protein